MDTQRTGAFQSCNLEQNPSISFPKPTNYSCDDDHGSSNRGPPAARLNSERDLNGFPPLTQPPPTLRPRPGMSMATA